MQKEALIGGALALVLGTIGIYYYMNQDQLCPRPETSKQENRKLAEEIFVSYMFAKQMLPKVVSEYETMIKEKNKDPKKVQAAKDVVNLFKTIDIIARGDLDALKNTPAQELEFTTGQLWIPGDVFNETLDGKIKRRLLAGQNALAFVLFHSSMNKTPAENLATLEMLKVLFDKKLNPHTKGGFALFIAEDPTKDATKPHEAVFSLQEIAQLYSFPEAQNMLAEYTANYKK